ncbi:hypothetical protein TSUD_118100 [Trifolium subterraneum]|uniref:Mind bomb SH3 repeat domain-containing protein n=1 Tax=Trifolium subterraneum TaxID=3900 RepID=A0A2Z6NW72_TRISU|nr:hypothetical protein TSUD_118100 [Trifolium subterraneum]
MFFLHVPQHGGGRAFKTLQWLVRSTHEERTLMGVIVVEEKATISRHLKSCAMERDIPIMDCGKATLQTCRQNKSLKWENGVGVVQGIGYEGDETDRSTYVDFCGEQENWVGPSSHLERVDKLFAGQKVRVKQSVKQPSIGTIQAIDADGKLRIYTPAGSKTWMLDPSEVEVVEEKELCIGDWASEMERVRPYKVGDKVRIRDGLVSPRWGWGWRHMLAGDRL